MPDDELKAIREREAKATPGPWTWADWSEDDGPNKQTLQCVVPFKDDFEVRLWGPRSPQGRPKQIIGCGDCTPDAREEDKDFLAHARQDVPALLAEVERLRAEVEAFERKCARWQELGIYLP